MATGPNPVHDVSGAVVEEIEEVFYPAEEELPPPVEELVTVKRLHLSRVTKLMNEFHEFQSDRIHLDRACDEHTQTEDSAELGISVLLGDGVKFSEHYVQLLQDLERTLSEEDVSLEQFLNSLDKGLQETVCDLELKAHPERVQTDENSACSARQRGSFIENIQVMVSSLVSDPSMKTAVDEDQSALQGVMQRLRTNESRAHEPLQQLCEGDEIPVVDLYGATTDDLNFMVRLFLGSNANTSAKHLLEPILSAFLPRVRVQSHPDPPPKQTQCSSCKTQLRFFQRQCMCFVCGERFCTKCPLHKRKAPCLGATVAQDVCRACFSKLDQQEASEWVETGIKCVKAGTLGSVKAAHGSFMVALCSGADISQSFLKLVQELLNLGWVDMALSMAVSLLHQSQDPEVSVEANYLAAEALSSMTDQPYLEWGERWILALAAKEALFEGASLQLQCPVVEVSELENQGAKVDLKLHQLYEQKEQQRDHVVDNKLQHLEQAWKARDWRQLLEVVLAESHEENTTIEALQQFLASKDKFFDRMLPEDQSPLLLLQGVVKLHYKNFTEGLADIQKAAWSGHHSEWLAKAAVDIVLCLLSQSDECKLPFQSLHEICQNLTADTILSSNGGSLSQLLPQAEELTPPFKLHWPGLVVSGLDVKATRKYEQAVVTRVKRGKWSGKDAALACIDLIPACKHSAEVAMCFLTAGLWFLKELQDKVSAGKQEAVSTGVYTLKGAVLMCLVDAYAVAYNALHPGMRLYISRLALRASLTAVQLSGPTSNDSALIVQLFKSVVCTSRFNPFCSMPIVNVSEAVLLNMISGQLLSQFLLGLQHVSPKEIHPVRDSELKYQLYENDLRHVCLLDSPDSARARAMEAMLDEKGWTWEDVADLMSSHLCPRNDEGWLIQQPWLGTSMEYAELVGFVLTVDPHESSIQLLVKPADKSCPGLFSQADVAEILTLEASTLSLSLKHPNKGELFHPFQELKYEPAELQGTNFLRTMFEADYLLKALSVGAEVSSNPPFKQRPTTQGLTAYLPPNFHNAIRPVRERGPANSTVHHFSIQNETKLIVDVEVSGLSQVFRIANPKMAICTHPLSLDESGELQDTTEMQDPDSPEAQFAADLTKHYDELSHHFPIFARLRELVKLQFLNFAVKNMLIGLQNVAQGNGVVVSDSLLQRQQQLQRTGIARFVEEISHVGASRGVWPKAESEDEVAFAESNIHTQLPHCGDHSTIRSHAIAFLHEEDQRILSEIVDAFMKVSQWRVPKSTMELHVREWLSGFSPQSQAKLVEVILSALPPVTRNDVRQEFIEYHARCLSNFSRVVDQVRGRPSMQGANGTSPCKWVPAVHVQQQVSNSTFSLSYGGVLLSHTFQPGRVPPTQGNVHTVTLNNINKSQMPKSLSSACPPSLAASVSSRSSSSGEVESGRQAVSKESGEDSKGEQTHQQRTKYKASNSVSASTSNGMLECRWFNCLNKQSSKDPKVHLLGAMQVALKAINVGRSTHESQSGSKAINLGTINADKLCQDSTSQEVGDEPTFWSDPDKAHVAQMYLLQTMGVLTDQCLQAGIAPNTKLLDALNTLYKMKSYN